MYGVSPAWFLSLYGDAFSCRQAADSLVKLAALGYDAWQPEIFLPERLNEWEGGAGSVLRARSEELGLTPSQFVAHFLLHAFESQAKLESEWGLEECRRLLQVLEEWPEIGVVTIPVPEFRFEGSISTAQYVSLYSRLVEKLSLMVGAVERTGRVCGLEIIPRGLVGGSEGYLRLVQNAALRNLKVNLDTGHFHAAAEPLVLTLARTGDVISGTHLCDNDGVVNASREPGAGTVEWSAFRQWAGSGGYGGSWDIEIRCSADEVERRYSDGLSFMRRLLNE